MSDLTVTIIITLGVLFTYGFMAGVMHTLVPEDAWDDSPAGVLSVTCWPVALPGILAVRLIHQLTRPRVPTARVIK